MKSILIPALLGLALTTAPGGAEAGCLTGAAVGGVAGHYAGHHGVLGAAAGCAVGHHEAKVAKQKRDAQAQARAPGSANAIPTDGSTHEGGSGQ